MSYKLKTLLSIAGSDPMGGAGIQADIKTGNALGLHVTTAITAVTSQNSKGFYQLGIIPHQLLESQLRAITEDLIPDAIKIGMIGNVENLEVIVNFIKSLPHKVSIVVDPVLKSTVSNSPLSSHSEELVRQYIEQLFPLATVITPNLKELEELSKGMALDFDHYMSMLQRLNVNAFVLTGLDLDNDRKVDLLFEKEGSFRSTHEKFECRNLHGTGCVFSSLLASYLGLKYNLKEAFQLASNKMCDIISQSCNYTLGNSKYGPLNINDYRI